jgi:carboxymethylenebutenolidase
MSQHDRKPEGEDEMQLHTEWIAYGDQSQYLGYVAKPQRLVEPSPAVLVIQEIWGVDEHIQDVTRRFAEAGFVAFAPDLYAKGGKRPDVVSSERIEQVKQFLDTLPPTAWGNPEEREKALQKLPEVQRIAVSETLTALFGGLKMELYIDQLLATTSFLRRNFSFTKGQGIASVGFCMGGALSALLASCDAELKGAVIFYGNAPEQERIPSIHCPILGFYGELDSRITLNVPVFQSLMKEAGKSFEPHIYQGAHHAFFNDTRSSYHPKAARDAFARTLYFLNHVLK